jgi:hypothetical protein
MGLYQVTIATDPLFVNEVKKWKTVFSELTPVESLPDSQAGQAYYWFVQPCVSESSCGPDADVAPERARSFRKESAAVKAIAPKGDGKTVPVVTDEVTFTWEDYLVTNRSHDGTVPLGFTQPEVVTQEARSYQVEVSTTASFQTVLETSPMLDQTTYTAETKTYPEGPLFWRVRAFDNTGNPLTYSCAVNDAQTDQASCELFEFEKRSPAPEQSLPAPAAVVTGAPALRWAAMPFTRSYDVEVYRNPGAALNASNRVVSTNTRATAAIATSGLSKGSYGWRVRRVDINGLPGRWTTDSNEGLRTFTVTGAVPNLLQPVAGGTVDPGGVLLQWDVVSSASRYRVEVSRDGFATVLESTTTDMTSWAPGLLNPRWTPGAYSWRVSTLDGANVALGTTASQAFVLGGPITAAQKGRKLVTPLDFTGDGRTDLLQVASGGDLLLYSGDGSGALSAAQKIGSGWGSFKTVLSPGDFSGDGRSDVLAINASGHLYLYRGNGKGGWAAKGQKIGSGWGTFKTVLAPGDFSGDGRSDVLAINASGHLYLYRGNGKGGWAAKGQKIGSGWGTFKTVVTPRDFSGDGRSDVLALDTAGALWLYKGSGRGGWSGSRVKAGSGWHVFSTVAGPGDVTSDKKADVLAITGAGDLVLYPGNGRGGWAGGSKKVATGF